MPENSVSVKDAVVCSRELAQEHTIDLVKTTSNAKVRPAPSFRISIGPENPAFGAAIEACLAGELSGTKRQNVAPLAEQCFCGGLLLAQFAVSSKNRCRFVEILKQTACLARQGHGQHAPLR